MLILIPWKPVVLVLGLLSGLVLVGFIASSLMEGKNPFAVDTSYMQRSVAKQSAAHTAPSHKYAHKDAPTTSQ